MVSGSGTRSREGSLDGSWSEAVITNATIPTLNAFENFIRKERIWDAKKQFAAHDDDMLFGLDDNEYPTIHSVAQDVWFACRSETLHFLATVFNYPRLLLTFILTFTLLTTGSVLAVNALKDSYETDQMIESERVARDSADWFKNEFQRALLPLYSVQQAVIHSPYFHHLSGQIGEYNASGSAPAVTGPKGAIDYRNITGICDDENLQLEFDKIVKEINSANNVDGAIVQYRLAPHSVFCYISPLINDKDFDGNVFNATGALGWDLLHTPSPMWQKTVRSTLLSPNNEIDIFGPFELAIEGTTLTPEMYCGHLGVNIPGDSIRIDGELVETWGFQEAGMEFRLTRSDALKLEDGSDTIKVNVIAESPLSSLLNEQNSYKIAIQTANGEWINQVGYVDGLIPSWYRVALGIAVTLSLLISLLLLSVLVKGKLHKALLYKLLPKRVIKKLQRGLNVVEPHPAVTIFFSDIIGFTSMAGEMSAYKVMEMLNDLYNEFDKRVEKHGVYKVETIGDAYMVVGGAPDVLPNPQMGAQRVALFSLDAMQKVNSFMTKDGERIFIRAGLHSGPVMAGVVGTAMPRYCFFGDTVNMSSRMESTSKKAKIQCSRTTRALLEQAPDHEFDLEQRREGDTVGVHVKGKGIVETWWIKGSTPLKQPRVAKPVDILGMEIGGDP